MKITRRLGTTLCAVALVASMFGQNEPYKNASLSPEERAADLVSRLTLEEKVALMQNASPAVPRLGIKPYEWWNEALHGVGRAGLATVFPQAIGMGASFDDALLYEVFSAVSDEARAKTRLAREEGSYRRYQGLTFWTPNINIFRDPRWGRGQETYSEDPFHTGQMGMAVVRGLQGPEDSKYDKAHACAKHFAVHSGPEWNRHSFDAKNIAPRDLWETYLPAFKDLVQKTKVKEVMCAYNRYEGDPCCGSDRLLMQILREEWGFEGIVVSDCWAINDFFQKNHHETHTNAVEATADAVLTGTDLECGSSYASLVEGVKAGKIQEKDIDLAVRRLMKARFELGEMDESTPWDTIPASVINSKKHQRLALEMARKSIVLLENENNLLPLKKGQTIALIGPNANDSVMQWGNYNGNPGHTVTLLEAMKAILPADQLIYLPACDRTSETSFVSLFGQCSTSKGQGFDVSFWANNQFEGKADATIRQTTSVNFTTDGATAVASGIPLANFSGIYRATFRPTVSDKVDFVVKMRGACTLLIDGKEVAKQERSLRRSTTLYTLDAQAGKSYDIELRYRHTEGRTASLTFDLGSTRPVDIDALLKDIAKADVVVFAGGIAPSLEGEEMPVSVPGFKGGDREDIQLPAVQRNVVKALKEAGKRVVFVNFSGSAMGLVEESRNCEAIIQAWYPGQAGGTAIVDVLFGKYNPAGRLPVTFYKDVKQLPDFQDYSMRGRTYRYFQGEALYPFGYGLSYTTFEYGKAKLSKNAMDKKETVTLTVPVKNTGKISGEEVVQVYIRRVADKEGPIKSLKAFKRIPLKAGQATKVELELPAERFECFDAESNAMRVMSGKYEIFYGSSSREEDLQKLNFVIK